MEEPFVPPQPSSQGSALLTYICLLLPSILWLYKSQNFGVRREAKAPSPPNPCHRGPSPPSDGPHPAQPCLPMNYRHILSLHGLKSRPAFNGLGLNTGTEQLLFAHSCIMELGAALWPHSSVTWGRAPLGCGEVERQRDGHRSLFEP